MKYKLITFLVLSIFLINNIYALEDLGTFKQGETVRVSQICNDATYITISSITYPNSTDAVSNFNMTYFGSGEFYYNFNSTNELGRYDVRGISDGCENTFAYPFVVTTTGITGQSILENNVLLILSFLSIVLLGLGASFKLPSLGFMGSIMLFLDGIYLTIYGLNNVADLYTQGAGITFVGLGFIFMFLSAYEWLGWGGRDEY